MLVPVDQRRLLGAFLRSHRERLSAEGVGLGGTRAGRRRTPGLRREEVAQMCGVSPTWYTWIEQGRDVSVSAASLARLAEALRLTPAERTYVFELTQRRDPAGSEAGARSERDPLRALGPLLDAVTQPAYLLDPLWRARAWNAPAAHLFADWLGAPEPNLLDYVFLDPRSRTFIPDWPDRARRIAAEFRADTGQGAADPSLLAFAERLRQRSPEFAAFWNDHAVLAREGGTRTFNHSRDGALRYDQVTLTPAGWPGHKVVVLSAQARSAP